MSAPDINEEISYRRTVICTGVTELRYLGKICKCSDINEVCNLKSNIKSG